MPERDEPRPSASPWSPAEPGEPEPDWADEIRQRRRARGERLREIFETFGDDDPTSAVPARSPIRPAPGGTPTGPKPEDRR